MELGKSLAQDKNDRLLTKKYYEPYELQKIIK